MAEELIEDKDKFKSVMNIDTSRVAINKMSEKCNRFESIKFLVNDIRECELETNAFSVVIDKACLDSILCAEDCTKNSKRALNEV